MRSVLYFVLTESSSARPCVAAMETSPGDIFIDWVKASMRRRSRTPPASRVLRPLPHQLHRQLRDRLLALLVSLFTYRTKPLFSSALGANYRAAAGPGDELVRLHATPAQWSCLGTAAPRAQPRLP